jgi:uncharacterized membrane protein HdeD (DUF308 family)
MIQMRKRFCWARLVMLLPGTLTIVMPLLSSLVMEIVIGGLLVVSGFLTALGAISLRKMGLFI